LPLLLLPPCHQTLMIVTRDLLTHLFTGGGRHSGLFEDYGTISTRCPTQLTIPTLTGPHPAPRDRGAVETVCHHCSQCVRQVVNSTPLHSTVNSTSRTSRGQLINPLDTLCNMPGERTATTPALPSVDHPLQFMHKWVPYKWVPYKWVPYVQCIRQAVRPALAVAADTIAADTVAADTVAADTVWRCAALRTEATAANALGLSVQGNDAARAALEDILSVPDLSDTGMSSATSDLLTLLSLIESINRCRTQSATFHRYSS
jgi:hypothetical protein